MRSPLMYLLSEWSTHPARGCQRILGEIRYKREEDETVYLPHAAADGIAGLMRRYMSVSSAQHRPCLYRAITNANFASWASSSARIGSRTT